MTNAESLLDVIQSMHGCSQRMSYKKNKEGSSQPFSFCRFEIVDVNDQSIVTLEIDDADAFNYEDACGAMVEYMTTPDGKSAIAKACATAAESAH